MNFFLTEKAAQTALNNQFGRFIELLLKSLEKKPHGEEGPLPGFDIRHVSESCIMLGIDGYALYVLNIHNDQTKYDISSVEIEQVCCLVKLNEATRQNFGLKSVTCSLTAKEFCWLFYSADLSIDSILKWIDSITNSLRRDVMEVFARAISRTTGVSSFEVDFEAYYDGLRINLDTSHIKDQIDTRFYKTNDGIYSTHKVDFDKHPTPKHMIDAVNEINEKLQKTVDAYVQKYKEVVESVGGTELILDDMLILTHRDFNPVVTGGFITFMCPYTNSMISMKSTNIECIEVRNYGRGRVSAPQPTSIVLISNQ